MTNDNNDNANWVLALNAPHIHAFLNHENGDNCEAGIHQQAEENCNSTSQIATVESKLTNWPGSWLALT